MKTYEYQSENVYSAELKTRWKGCDKPTRRINVFIGFREKLSRTSRTALGFLRTRNVPLSDQNLTNCLLNHKKLNRTRTEDNAHVANSSKLPSLDSALVPAAIYINCNVKLLLWLANKEREAIDDVLTKDWLQKHLKLLLLCVSKPMGGLKLLFWLSR